METTNQFIGLCSRSFYGSKKIAPLNKRNGTSKPVIPTFNQNEKNIDQNPVGNNLKKCNHQRPELSLKKSTKPVKRKFHDSIYYAKNVCKQQKKKKKDLFKSSLNDSSHSSFCTQIDPESCFASVSSQTSFPSSSCSSQETSPLSCVRNSPFIYPSQNNESSPVLFSGSTPLLEESDGANSDNVDSEDNNDAQSEGSLQQMIHSFDKPFQFENERELSLSHKLNKDFTNDSRMKGLNSSVRKRNESLQESEDLTSSMECKNNNSSVTCNTSTLTSESNSDCLTNISQKTIKKSTILNYFSKVKSDINTFKLESKEQIGLTSAKTTSRQLRLVNSSSVSPKPRKEEHGPFNLPVSPRPTSSKKLKTQSIGRTPKRLKKEQSYIDIGQRDFGHVTCQTCGMIYTKSQEEDEAQHAKYHQRIVQKLKFNGWKSERVVEEYHDGRIILVKSTDHHLHLKKLGEVKDIVDTELGFSKHQDLYPKTDQQVFLFISSKKVIGCVIALPVQKAYPVIPTLEATEEDKKSGAPTLSWCCSSDPVSALCGISRIWVFSQNRRQNIATRLVDCIRHHFLYGCVIPKNKIAFSDPTPNGRIFAEKFTGRQAILVFR